MLTNRAGVVDLEGVGMSSIMITLRCFLGLRAEVLWR